MRNLAALVLCCATGAISAQQVEWTNIVFDHDVIWRYLTTDPAGNTFVMGPSWNDTDLDPGTGTFTFPSDPRELKWHITKLDADGAHVWSIPIYGDALADFDAYDITPDASGNIHVAGRFGGSVDFDPGPGTMTLTAAGIEGYAAKYDAAGALVWVRQLDGVCQRITVDDQGNSWIAGMFSSSTDFDPGVGTFMLTPNGTDAFLWKLDASGALLWAGVLTCSNIGIEFTELTTNPAGALYAAGWHYDTADFDPGAATWSVTADTIRTFVLKLEANGDFAWVVEHKGDGGWDVAVDANGDVLMSGFLKGVLSPIDMDPGPGTFNLSCTGRVPFVWKLNDAGQLIWARQMGDQGLVDDAVSVALDAQGNVVTIGTANGIDLDPGPGTILVQGPNYPFFINVIDPSGNHLWGGWISYTSLPGTAAAMNAWGVHTDAAGNMYAGGVLSGTCDIDPGPGVTPYVADSLYGNNPGLNGFVIKLSAMPTSIAPSETAGFGLHPMPVENVLRITSDQPVLGSTLRDMQGRVVRNFPAISTLDLSGLPTGAYVLEVRTAAGRAERTVMKR